MRQITKQQRREELLRRLANKTRTTKHNHANPSEDGDSTPVGNNSEAATLTTSVNRKRKRLGTRSERGKDPVSLSFDDQDPLVSAPPSSHHQISENNRYRIDLAPWLSEHAQDRAVEVIDSDFMT